jgi:hypothetical protein
MSELGQRVLKKIAAMVTVLQTGTLYLVMVVILALISFGFLVYEWTPGAVPEIVRLGDEVDLVVASIFLLDFFLGLFFNTKYKSKSQYWKYNWLDFISSVPITNGVTQGLRLLRIWRATKVLRVAINIWTAKQQLDIQKELKG